MINVEDHMKLVYSYCRRWKHRPDFEDFIGEGMIALVEAARDFDTAQNCQFSTLAVTYIRNRISRNLLWQGSRIAIPENLRAPVMAAQALIQLRRAALGIDPDPQDIADEIGNQFPNCDPTRLLNALRALGTTVGDSDSIGNDGRFAVDETESAVNVLARNDDDVDLTEVRDLLSDLLSDLPDRDREVLDLRYGLTDGQERTLQDVADIVGLTKERVRQVENKALARSRQALQVA